MAECLDALRALTADVNDEIAVMATIVGELHHRDARFDWTGFYRVTTPGVLTVGPYQGGHGCLVIPFERGVCGRCAREQRTIVVPDVMAVADHIACSATTRSEVVVPVFDAAGRLRAVLDVDSDMPDAFDPQDVAFLERVCLLLRDVFPTADRSLTAPSPPLAS